MSPIPINAIIRACAVTENASQTTREFIRSAKKNGSYVIASGCLENRNLAEIDCVAETAGDILTKVSEIKNFMPICNRSSNNKISIKKTRLFIKIQTGCNFNCAYCVIPHFRGKSKSVSADLIIKKINEAEKFGYHEVVLTGVNICQYKYRHINITSLIKQILDISKEIYSKCLTRYSVGTSNRVRWRTRTSRKIWYACTMTYITQPLA